MTTDVAPQSTGAAPASTGSGGSTGFLASSTGVAFAGWGDNWRQHVSGGDAQELKRLERFQGPENIYKSFRELESKVSAGELVPVLRKDATAEEAGRWRKQMGIPEKPDGYKMNLPAGVEPPEEDSGFVKAFMKSAHEANYTQGQFDSALKAFYAEVDRQQKAIGESEKAAETETEEALRKEWGVDYRANKAMAEALLNRAPSGFRDRFMNGFLADHTPIRASAEAWKWLVQMEREINPAATVVPGAGGDLGKTVEAEIQDLQKMMANSASDYWKGPKAESLQQRLRDLLDAQEKIRAKAA